MVVVLAGAGGIAYVATRPRVDPGRALDGRPCPRLYTHLAMTPVEKSTYELRRVDTAGSVDPAAIVFAPDGSGDGFLGDRDGRVARIVAGHPTDDVVLDFTGRTQTEGDGGLLGLAYAPDQSWLYVYRATEVKDDVVTAYPLDADGVPDPDREVQVIAVDHPPSEQHHGGGFAFGPDGNLWIGFGDGGGLGDPHENGQRTTTLLGKIVRISPTPDSPQGDHAYTIPEDNPFAHRDGYRPEIWATGLRNPWRLSFDDDTGDLWISDVGQACYEELDVLPAADGRLPGANLGWDSREGTEPFEGDDIGETVQPVHVNAHRDGFCATSAGFVLRDGQLPGLDGFLLNTDYCKGRILAFRPGTGIDDRPILVDTGLRIERPVGIFEGPDGVPWVLSLNGDVWRILPVEATAAP